MLRRTLLPALVFAPALARAQARPLRLIIPFAAGGAADVLGRHYAEAITSQTGQPVVVENRGAANGILAVQAVSQAPPDGGTLGVFSITFFAALPFMLDRPPYDPAADLTPVARIANATVMCCVTPERARERGWTDFRAMLEWGKRPGNRITTGSARGVAAHLIAAAIAKRSGAEILHVPYRGGAPAVQDFLGGTLDMIFDAMPQLMPHVAAGRAVPIAVGSQARSPFFPAVPGMGEFADLGLGDLDVQTWTAMVGPAAMPEAAVAATETMIRRAAQAPDLPEKLKASGLVLSLSENSAALRAEIARQTPAWREMVVASGARLD
jgi:tripartite-type tricarboxylate transporter receptor subunit TctC